MFGVAPNRPTPRSGSTSGNRFNRTRYNAATVVAAFAARLKDTIDLDLARYDLAGVVRQTLEPAHVSVWMSERG